MQDIREFLKNHLLITDGAMGTYVSSLTGRGAAACEMFNRSNPGLIYRVHSEYVKCGARMILTNTFGANTVSLKTGFDKVGDIIKAGVSIARHAAGDNAYVAGDIGPMPDTGYDADGAEEEYLRIADVFLDEGIRIFQFETFADAEFPVKTAEYIRSKVKDAFIVISFAVTPDGYSHMGLRGSALVERVKKSPAADAVGFNCCSGPAHLLSFASGIDYGTLIPCISPNAGYPEQEEEVLVYSGSPRYFSGKLAEAPGAGFRILGGCCGTTPEHIRQLAARVGALKVGAGVPGVMQAKKAAAVRRRNPFEDALRYKQKTVVVEMDPPFDSDVSKLEENALAVKNAGADVLTVADSPMSRPRADSIVVAARLRRVAGIDVIPHLCCRDRNINAIRSALVAAHMEGIRNILAVTGDPVPDTERGAVKSVFNLNSAGLCGLIRDLNEDIFKGDPLLCGCAFNVNARNIEEELRRLDRKIASGAAFVLTQAVFTEASVEALMRARLKNVKLLAMLLTPLSYKNALFFANEIPGIGLPEEYVRCFSPDMTRGQGEEAGIALSLSMAEKVAPYCDGYYVVTPFGRAGVTARLISELKARGII